LELPQCVKNGQPECDRRRKQNFGVFSPATSGTYVELELVHTIVSMTSRVYGMVVVVGVDVILFKTGLLDLTSTLSLTTYDVSNDTIYPKLYKKARNSQAHK